MFLCKFQVISQAEQEQAELEVKTTKHEIFKVTLSLHTQLNNTELKPITELGNEHCDKNIIPPLATIWTSLECKSCIPSEKEENGNNKFYDYDSTVLILYI